jgi:hypothetical protein
MNTVSHNFSAMSSEISGRRSGDLFREPIDLDVNAELIGAVAFALREARRRGLSRERIVDAMNATLPKAGITTRKLSAWSAESKDDHPFPARYLPAFCAATDCDLPLRVLARTLGLEIIDHQGVAAMQVGQMQAEAARLERGAKQILKRLGDHE